MVNQWQVLNELKSAISKCPYFKDTRHIFQREHYVCPISACIQCTWLEYRRRLYLKMMSEVVIS